MPRGKKNLKGRAKKFTSPEELEQQRQQEANWRNNGEESSDEDSSSDDEKNEIIQTNNPNRVVNKEKKLSQLDDITSAPTELSRKEREEIQKQEAARRYQQLHAQGKTDEARADLARLAIVRKQREEAARQRDEEKKEREARQNAAKAASLNAIKNKGGGGGRKKRK